MSIQCCVCIGALIFILSSDFEEEEEEQTVQDEGMASIEDNDGIEG